MRLHPITSLVQYIEFELDVGLISDTSTSEIMNYFGPALKILTISETMLKNLIFVSNKQFRHALNDHAFVLSKISYGIINST